MIFNREKYNVVEIQSTFKIILVENFLKRYGLPYNTGGWGNGYVCLPEWHPWFKKHYDDIEINIHGGLTFSEYDINENVWVIGFDTDHYGDNETNCTYEYILNEVKKLEQQCLDVDGVKEKIRLEKIKNLLNG